MLCLTAQYATNKEVATPLPVLGGREAVPDSSKVVPSNIAVQGAKKDVKGGKNRQKWRPQWVATIANYNDDDDKYADNSDMAHVVTAGHNVKHQTQPPTDHFE
jgi:hypothetical protein